MLTIISLFIILCPQITFAADTARTQVSLTVPQTDAAKNQEQISKGNNSTSDKPASKSDAKQTLIPETGDKHFGEIIIYFGIALLSLTVICILTDITRKKNRNI